MKSLFSCRLNLVLSIPLLYCALCICPSKAFAVARFGACNIATSGTGTGADGSNCDLGLMCDVNNSKICVYPTETGCLGGRSTCPIGQRCTTDQSGTAILAANGIGGSCTSATNVSSENNAISDVICNAYGFVTGKVGRGIIVIVVFVTGVTFYLGKVSWGTVVAILIGAGLCFGGPAIVSVLIGGGKTC